MGHYAAEMSCPKCDGVGGGPYSCICPPPADERTHWYVVDTDFTVQTAEEYLEKNNGSEGSRMRLLFLTRFEHREQAEMYARDDCERAVEVARARLLALKKICKVLRPWEKK